MALPDGSYICVTMDQPLFCLICGDLFFDIVVNNEVVFREGQFLGIEGVVRFEDCGHFVFGATADPLSVAFMLEQMEADDAEEE